MPVQPKLYSHFTYQNGVSIVSLFISTGRLAMPDFDGWSQQVLTLFLLYEVKNTIFKEDEYELLKDKEVLMPLFRITVKQSKNSNGIRLEKGMSVEVVSNSFSNPVSTNGGQPVVDAFNRIYGVDIKKAGALSMVYLDVQRIG